MAKFTRLPLITGFGGYNAAGRSSGHNAYKRMVIESLSPEEQDKTYLALATLMGLAEWKDGHYIDVGGQVLELGALPEDLKNQIKNGTLVRQIENALFDVQKASLGQAICFSASEDKPATFTIAAKNIPVPLPEGWKIVSRGDRECRVETTTPVVSNFKGTQVLPVQAAGQLPNGFNPGDHYRSLHHPRGLQLAVMAASDAVHSMGVSWETVLAAVEPDQVSVYSSSVMSQLDPTGFGGMMHSRQVGARVTSKQLALGLNTMSADFVNAYVLGNVGSTGGITGACATFLYNLRAAVEDIKSGRCRVAVVGSAEAPILPEIIDGYSAMSALATDADLRNLDGVDHVNYRRASRPFGENCGFTLAESAQYVVLMDDELTLELGAKVYGAVPGVFVNADGFKKSISAPGPGNYITVGKAVALAKSMLGAEAVQQRSFVQAHGSSTPQNRVTESKIFDKLAQVFGIESWPVSAVKAYLGHSLGPASGDQMAATLGVFEYGILPGIKTITEVASDVNQDRLNIAVDDIELGKENCDVAFLNSKGFGGNNATATVLSPSVAYKMLEKRHSSSSLSAYNSRLEQTKAAAEKYETEAAQGSLQAIYHFGQGLIDEQELSWTTDELKIPGFEKALKLNEATGYDDLIEL